LPYTGKIRLEVTATNLAAPIRLEASIDLREAIATWSDLDVLETLEPWIAEKLI
jgi:hypothetical protein